MTNIRRYLNIDVTQEDIRQGGRRDTSNCPIAHALSRRLKGAAVNVCFERIVAHSEQAHYEFYCSRDIEQFMTDFDEARPVRPSRFTLEQIR